MDDGFDAFKELGGHDMILRRLALIVRTQPGIPFEVAWRRLQTQLNRDQVLAIVLQSKQAGHDDAIEAFEHEGQMHLVSAADASSPSDRAMSADRTLDLAIAVTLLPDLRLRSAEIRAALAKLGWTRSQEQVRVHLQSLVAGGKVHQERGTDAIDMSNRNIVYFLNPRYAKFIQTEDFQEFELRFLAPKAGPELGSKDTSPSRPGDQSGSDGS